MVHDVDDFSNVTAKSAYLSVCDFDFAVRRDDKIIASIDLISKKIDASFVEITSQTEYRPSITPPCVGVIFHNEEDQTIARIYETRETIHDIAETLARHRGEEVTFEVTYLPDEEDAENRSSGYVTGWEIHASKAQTVDDVVEDMREHGLVGNYLDAVFAKQKSLK